MAFWAPIAHFFGSAVAACIPSALHYNLYRKNSERSLALQQNVENQRQKFQERLHDQNRALQRENMEFQERQRHDTLKAQALIQERSLAAQAWNTDRMIAANEQLEAKRQEFRKAELQLQEMQRLHTLSVQSQEQEKNRQLQSYLAELNRELTKQEGKLSRQLQRELAALNRQVQINEGKLNREHALRLEEFRAEMQRWAFEQQRELQLQLKRHEADLAMELRRFDRATALNQLREQKRLSNLPICLLSEEILRIGAQQDFPPLRVFFSPPNARFDQTVNPKHSVKHFPALEEHFSEQVLTRHIRPLSGSVCSVRPPGAAY